MLPKYSNAQTAKKNETNKQTNKSKCRNDPARGLRKPIPNLHDNFMAIHLKLTKKNSEKTALTVVEISTFQNISTTSKMTR